MKVVDDARAARLVSKVRGLLSGKSDAGHSHAASDISSGALPVARGGTGASSAEQARANLSAASVAPPDIDGNQEFLESGNNYLYKARPRRASDADPGSGDWVQRSQTIWVGKEIDLGDAQSSSGLPDGRSVSLSSPVWRGALDETRDWDGLPQGTYKVAPSASGNAFSASLHQPAGAYAYGTLVAWESGGNAFQLYAAHSAGQLWFRERFSSSNEFSAWRCASTSDHSHAAATQSAAGLMSAADKKKLDGVAAGANAYAHPSATAYSSGLYKIATNALGHVTSAAAVTKADITALGIPGQDTNTTYAPFGAAGASAAGSQGLVPAPAAGDNAKFLRGDRTWTAVTPALIGAAASSHTHSNYYDANTSRAANTVLAAPNGSGGAATFRKLVAADIPSLPYAASSHTHSYLPLSGGTLTGRLTANGKLTLPSTAGTWISGMTLTNPSIQVATQQSQSNYHPYLGVKTYGGHVVNMGGLGDSFGFYGFKSGRTENATDWAFTFNASTGAVSSTGGVTAPTFTGALSGNASTATALTSSAGGSTQPVYFSGGKPVACAYTLGKSVPSNAVFTDTNTWVALKGSTSSAAGTAGYAPAPAAGASNRYLRCDGTWQVPPDTNTTYAAMKAATASAAGASGLVPAPAAGAQAKYLRGDGTWQVPTNTTYAAATQSAAGLMSAADKKKLDGVAAGANVNNLTWQQIYPVGAVYISYTSTSPASLFGGTWTQITGRFLRMANDVSTGGADTVALTQAQMPSHTHGVQGYFNRVNYNSYSGSEFELSYHRITSDNPSTVTPILEVGSGSAHSNMPAYQDLYAWRRTG